MLKDTKGNDLYTISDLASHFAVTSRVFRGWVTSKKVQPCTILPNKVSLFYLDEVKAELGMGGEGKETSKDVTESWGEVEEVPDVVPTKGGLDKVGIGGYTKAEIAEQRETAKRNGALAALKWAEEAEEETTKRNAALEWAEEEYEEDITDIFNP